MRSARGAETGSVSPARLTAFRTLLRVERDEAFAAPLLASERLADLSAEDRRLAHELTLGVLRWRGELDYLINVTADRPAEKLNLPVRIALWLGLYQLRHLERIPEHAAVSESVELIKHGVHRRAAPLVNAALRAAVRDRPAAPDERVRNPLNRLSIEASHPRWLLERWVAQFGDDETAALARANNVQAPTALRINPLRAPSRARALEALSDEGVTVRNSTVAPDALVVTGGHLSQSSHLLRDGWAYVQDEASQLVAHLLGARPGEAVLDLCAAPGSKTTLVAAAMDNRGTIVAVDRHRARLATLAELCARLGVRIALPLAADASHDLPIDPHKTFDRVLVDAPCSGTGTLRRNPEIKWRLAACDIERFATLQRALLREAAARVRPGGRLVYSTCSLEPEENEQVVQAFLAESTAFSTVDSTVPAGMNTADGFLRTLPHRDGADGFFAAVLERA